MVGREAAAPYPTHTRHTQRKSRYHLLYSSSLLPLHHSYTYCYGSGDRDQCHPNGPSGAIEATAAAAGVAGVRVHVSLRRWWHATVFF